MSWREAGLAISLTLISALGMRIMRSVMSQSRASQIRSMWSMLTRSANSWYKSLMVAARIPVDLARSAWVHRRSPSRVESKIRIIAMLLSVDCNYDDTILLDIGRIFRIT